MKSLKVISLVIILLIAVPAYSFTLPVKRKAHKLTIKNLKNDKIFKKFIKNEMAFLKNLAAYDLSKNKKDYPDDFGQTYLNTFVSLCDALVLDLSEEYPDLPVMSRPEVNALFAEALGEPSDSDVDNIAREIVTSNPEATSTLYDDEITSNDGCSVTLNQATRSLASAFNSSLSSCGWWGLAGVPFGGGTVAYAACVSQADSTYDSGLHDAWNSFRHCEV